MFGINSLHAQTYPKKIDGKWVWGNPDKRDYVVDSWGEIKLDELEGLEDGGVVELINVIRIPEGKTLTITTSNKNITIRNTNIGRYPENEVSSVGRSRMFTVKGLKSDITEHGKLEIRADEGYKITLDGGATFTINGNEIQRNANNRTLSEAIANEGNLELENVVIQNVDGADANGGAINVSANANETKLENCKIQNCYSIGNGGAIYASTKASININNCIIESCSAGGTGGAVYASSKGKTTFNNCKIDSCRSVNGGGAFALHSSGETEFDECTVTNCSTNDLGGGMYVSTSGIVTFKNGTIEKCVSQRGSAIMLLGSGKLTIEKSVIKKCLSGGGTISNSGGTIRTYGSTSASLHLKEVTFTENHARRNTNWNNNLSSDGNGGALFWNARGTSDTQCVIEGCTFVGNRSDDNGGAIKSQGTLIFQGETTKITGNTAPVGAGLYIEGYQGGATVQGEREINYNLNGSMYIHNNTSPTYTHNGITYPGLGAGIHLHFGPEMSLESGSTINLNLEGAIIENNTAEGENSLGGGIYFENTSDEVPDGSQKKDYTFNINMNYGTISGNKATNGAGIYVYKGSIGSEINSETLSVKNNTASGNGGGIFVMNGNMTMNSGSISGNKALSGNGGGIYIYRNINNGEETDEENNEEIGKFTINGGVIYGNSAHRISNGNRQGGNGGGVYMNGGNFIQGTGSKICNNYNDENGGGVCIVNGGSFKMEGGEITGNGKNPTGTRQPITKNGGGVYLNGGNFTLSDGSITLNSVQENGGGVFLTGDNCVYTLTKGNITGNSSSNGGGVYLEKGMFNLGNEDNVYDGNISENRANKGGGVYIGSASGNTSTINTEESNSNEGFKMLGGKIEKNYTSSDGGGVYLMGGDFTLIKGTIKHNESKTNGGGVYLNGGKFKQENGYVQKNFSKEYGGGVCIMNGNFEMKNGEISLNGIDSTNNITTTTNGGGVYLNRGKLSVELGSIKSNSSLLYGGGIYIHNGEVDMGDGEISYNRCNNNGGGVYIFRDASSAGNELSVEFKGGKIQSNRALNGYGGGLCVDGKIILNIEGVTINKDTARNGGGVCLLNGATMNFGNGWITENIALGAENSYDNTTAYMLDIADVEGIGGGIFMNSNTTLIFNPEDSNEYQLGLYHNIAYKAADELFANGDGTIVKIPDVSTMTNLKNFTGGGNLKWIEDYVTNDTGYEHSPKKLQQGTILRYRDMIAQNNLNIPKFSGGETYSNGDYISFALGYETIYMTIVKNGLCSGESAIFTIQKTENGEPLTNIKPMRVILTGTDENGGPVSKLIGVTAGEWKVTETPWSWTYSGTPQTGITKDITDKNNRTFEFTNTKTEDSSSIMYDEKSIIKVME